MKSLKLIFLLQIVTFLTIILFHQPSTKVDCLKINKNTVEMLNNGLRALLSIKRILSTIKSVNELTGQAFPHLLNSAASSSAASSALGSLGGAASISPKMRLVSKIFGGSGSGGSHGGSGKALSTASLVEGMAAAVQGKRNSMGMIKIGEKPPPGLFPETLPYSISPGSSSETSQADLLNAVSAISGSGNGNVNNNLLSTSELFSKLVAAAAANGQLSESHSESESSEGSSASQLIPHFSNSDLKTSSSNIRHNLLQLQPSKMVSSSFFPRRLLLPLSSSSSYHSNMFNDNQNNNNDGQSFEGTFEVLQN